ncbi:unnamed protein product [Phytophthora lilii]|uniref:Unnamed protein product n=1 Tax=Phytophthora lilii TaxID=2077276 RepID=A0A9W6WV26_9STRA|nr:unnamed protein product [Phytophthora lilii]
MDQDMDHSDPKLQFDWKSLDVGYIKQAFSTWASSSSNRNVSWLIEPLAFMFYYWSTCYFWSPGRSSLVETKPMSATDVENMTARGATNGPAIRRKSRNPHAVTFLGTS